MTISEYKELRKMSIDVNTAVFKTAVSNRRVLKAAAKELGLWKNGTVVAEKDIYTTFLMDFIVFEQRIGNRNGVERFYDTADSFPDEVKEELLESMLDAFFSIFIIVDRDSATATVTLRDVLGEDGTVHTMMDMGFSRTAVIGDYIGLRMLPVRDTYMTTGAPFGFLPQVGGMLLMDYQLRMMNRKNRSASINPFLLCFEWYRKNGRDTLLQDV